MKFAREYQATLQQEQYPQHWIQSSISYRQLKKCIRKIQAELSQLGLDAEAVDHLLRSAGPTGSQAVPVAAHDISNFKPKLVFLVRFQDGDLVDATLSPKTKETLQRLVATSSTLGRGAAPVELQPQSPEDLQSWHHSTNSRGPVRLPSTETPGDPQFVRVEVPLRNNDEFFHILQHCLSGLNALHGQEKTALSQEIGDLSKVVSRLARPVKGMQRTDLYAWREIFNLYLESNVFFSTNESESSSRSPAQAQRQLQVFSNRLDNLQKSNTILLKDSKAALRRFLLVNANLLRILKFQQLNMRAAGKILKKFDKRTSLGASNSLAALLGDEALSPQTMAKVMCSQLSNEILAIVPQLNDYICPVCFSISYKPVRLGCGHVFCIRCMVVMQRSRQSNCPLCRGDVIMQADSANLDLALMKFLKAYFPLEVKQKQKDNERGSAIDQYGSDYEKCTMM
ncbi:MAG: hypothetical protein L6R38_000136 [Xanthoria sp. 2 TBL-2021]|nr:MAG: hypothetical protein L6R38_000136 [Xanthoria sp. 2 TBL-2021]